MNRSTTVDTHESECVAGIVEVGLVSARAILAAVVAINQHGE